MTKGGKGKNELSAERLEGLVTDLQKHDCHIADNYLRNIISFGDEAIPHLEKILRETLDNRTKIDINQQAKPTETFKIVHVFNLLSHLEASVSLKLVFEFLAQEQKYVEYWLDDIFDEDLWEVLFKLGNNNLLELKYFLLNKRNNEFYRLATAKALIQIALNNKHHAKDIRNIFHTLLILEDEDRDFVGLVISELLEWHDKDLKAIILKKLNEVDVYEGIISADEVEYLFAKNKQPFTRQPQDIFERYAGYREVLPFGDKKRKSSANILKDIKFEKTPDSDFNL